MFGLNGAALCQIALEVVEHNYLVTYTNTRKYLELTSDTAFVDLLSGIFA